MSNQSRDPMFTENGNAIIEFAIVLSFFMIMLAATFNLGAASTRSSEVQSPEELEAQRAVMRQGIVEAMEQSRSLQNSDPDSGDAGVGGSR